ncbi:hypothetical protein COU17_03030 [Candidatus Kaiserbacteria bacterium CG10_big_fil_rev_8_21_14_0_10_49_17]|uniref:2'-deoxycytidine 5'-triphosphate deaminase n=1 Tax=Candidatus Kaiserbacteria bacterium CG10_big_fil_rev_8_21_14_0_10_49_17 TaxID=1974609 RepID=A0A2M6WDT7_9BACT|nr:MAG: hypothetical protein COU17_03030 [Candidatus Kaiserbacteria bacterium CG10_big_fil_rev_8_21_14_0_10_49_17]
MPNHKGAVPRQILADMLGSQIKGANAEHLQPSSLDLTLSSTMFRMPGTVQPDSSETIEELVNEVGAERHNLANSLERDVVYLARLNEKVSLSRGVYGYSNPKSTTGRLDVHARLLVDRMPRFDKVPEGHSGKLWALIVPRSFPIRVHSGSPLTQLRLFTGDTRLSELELQIEFEKGKLLYTSHGERLSYSDLEITDQDGSIILTADLTSNPVGWECTSPSEPLDLGRQHFYNAEQFFRPVRCDGGYLHLKKGRFYILSTAEFVRVPPHLACEMRPMDDRAGEFRVHYAGFIDPGWGYGKEGKGKGRPLTLEVRPHEDMIVRLRQPIAKIRFERMLVEPDTHYDAGSPNYGIQSGPRLAKQFKTT